MSVRFSPVQIGQMKKQAKVLGRSQGIAHTHALDEIARHHGWRNWSLLAKNSLPDVQELVSVACRPYAGGPRGVFLAELWVQDAGARALMEDEQPSFSLPQVKGWWFRGVEPEESQFAPYIDLQATPPRGVFLDGRWYGILSVIGVQPADLQSHIETTGDAVLAALRVAAVSALLPRLTADAPLAGGRVRLFVTEPGRGGAPVVTERSYASVEEAKAADFPPEAVRVGIPLGGGRWLSYKGPSGWSEEASS